MSITISLFLFSFKICSLLFKIKFANKTAFSLFSHYITHDGQLHNFSFEYQMNPKLPENICYF